MVMVNESIERERERGKRPGVPEICGWLFDVARRGFGGVRKLPRRGRVKTRATLEMLVGV